MSDLENFTPSDRHPCVAWKTDTFLIARVGGEDDYRIGCIGDGEICKWMFPNSRHDVSFDRADLVDFHALLGRVLEANPPDNRARTLGDQATKSPAEAGPGEAGC